MKQKPFKTTTAPGAIRIGNGISIYNSNIPKQDYLMHWHDFYEFELMLAGEGILICNDKTYEIKPGLVSFVTPLDFHEIHMKSDVHELCVQFAPESISKDILSEFQNVKNPVFYCSEEQIERIITLFNLLKNVRTPRNTEKEYNSHILESILISLKDDFDVSDSTLEQSPTSIQKALLYIHSHFKENPKMSDVAKMLYLNENYFCSLFKEHMGETYKDYIKKLRLDYAKKLILNTDIPLTQIAMECGYSSQSNFNRNFKDFFRTSPSEMRNNIAEVKNG